MPYTPENSAIKMTPELETALNKASSPEEMKDILHHAAIEQALVVPDIYDASNLLPTEKATAPQARRFAKKLDGQFFEGDSELEVEKAIGDYMRAKINQPEARTDVQPRDEQGRFTADQGRADENAVQRAELDMRFKRGEISTEEYLTASGAIERYLEEQGVPLEDLKASVAEKQAERYEQSWQDATKEFLNSSEGRSWPGGQENLQRVGTLIQKMGNENAQDKVGALTAAYRYMKVNDLVASNPELERERRIREARSPEDLRIALEAHSADERRIAGGSSSPFSR
jgi:hypothetical protein